MCVLFLRREGEKYHLTENLTVYQQKKKITTMIKGKDLVFYIASSGHFFETRRYNMHPLNSSEFEEDIELAHAEYIQYFRACFGSCTKNDLRLKLEFLDERLKRGSFYIMNYRLNIIISLLFMITRDLEGGRIPLTLPMLYDIYSDIWTWKDDRTKWEKYVPAPWTFKDDLNSAKKRTLYSLLMPEPIYKGSDDQSEHYPHNLTAQQRR